MPEPASSPGRRPLQLDPPISYAAALALVGAALGIKLALGAPASGATFQIFAAAVLVASWIGGFGPGLVATIAAAILGVWAIAAPSGALRIEDPDAFAELALFLAEGGVFAWVGGRMRAVRREDVALALRREEVSRTEGERERLAERADEALAQLELLYREAPVGLCQVDREYRWLRINERLAEINGYPVEAHIGRSVRELLPAIADETEGVFRKIFETGQPVLDYELTGETPAQPGVQRTWIESWYPVRNAKGEVASINVVCREVTEEKRAAAALAASEAALRDADRRKDEFLAMLAHELRNPLAPIRNAVGVFRAVGVGDPLLARSLDIVDRQVTQMTRLVDDLLDVSRIARGQFPLQREPLRVAEIIELAVETARPLAELGMHELEIAAVDASVELVGDRARLVQVVGNLLSNAAKFTPRGGRIAIDAGRDGEWAVIRVRDDGIGFEPASAERLFDLFAQEDDPLVRSHGGLGIGLALVRQIVEMHGGRVTATSDGRGRGAEFRVALPVAPRDETTPTPPAPARTTSRAAGRRVLIVEDNADAAESLRMLLAIQGHDAHVSGTGCEALRAFEAFEPQVAFVDLGLPDIDGFEVARRMRVQAGGRSCLLVALSGYGREEDRRRAREAGFDHHVTKPLERETMRNLLEGTSVGSGFGAIH